MSSTPSSPLADRIAGLAGEIRPGGGAEGRSLVQQGVEAVIALAIRKLLLAFARLAQRFADGLVRVPEAAPEMDRPEPEWSEGAQAADTPVKGRGFLGWLGGLLDFGPTGWVPAEHAPARRRDGSAPRSRTPGAARTGTPRMCDEAGEADGSADEAGDGGWGAARESRAVRPAGRTRRCGWSAGWRGWPAATAGPGPERGCGRVAAARLFRYDRVMVSSCP